MLPPMAELVPPLLLDDFALVDLIHGPQVLVRLVEEDGLEDVAVVRPRCFEAILVGSELVLVVCAVEGHLDFLGILRVAVSEIHGSVPAGLTTWTRGVVFRKGDLVFLRSGLGLSGEVWVELRLIEFLEVIDVGVGYRDIIVESRATEDELLSPTCCLAQQSLGVVR